MRGSKKFTRLLRRKCKKKKILATQCYKFLRNSEVNNFLRICNNFREIVNGVRGIRILKDAFTLANKTLTNKRNEQRINLYVVHKIIRYSLKK